MFALWLTSTPFSFTFTYSKEYPTVFELPLPLITPLSTMSHHTSPISPFALKTPLPMSHKYCPSDEALYDSDDESVQYGELNPLQTASKVGDLSQVQHLVEDYAESHSKDETVAYINENSYRRYNALSLAGAMGHWDVVRFLVENGAQVDNFTTKRNHSNALLFAVIHGNTEMVDFLIQHGGDINNCYDANGKYPLFHCVENQKSEMVNFLLHKGANPNIIAGPQGKDTILSLAITRGFVDIIPALQHYKAVLPPHDPDAKEGLYDLITVSSDLDRSLQVAFAIKNPENPQKAYYGATAVGLAIYGLIRGRKPFEQRQSALDMLLNYSHDYQLDVVNTKIPLPQSFISLLVNFDQEKVDKCFSPLDPDAIKGFTPYDLAVIANKQAYIMALAPHASDETIASAREYAVSLGY